MYHCGTPVWHCIAITILPRRAVRNVYPFFAGILASALHILQPACSQALPTQEGQYHALIPATFALTDVTI